MNSFGTAFTSRLGVWVQGIALVCLCLAWLVPNHYPPWMSFYNESVALIGLFLLILSLGRRNLAHVTPTPVWALTVVAVVPWLQLAVGRLTFAGDAVVFSAYLVALAASVTAGYAWAVADREAAASRLSGTMLAGALVSALLGLAQAFGAVDLGLWAEATTSAGRAVANLGQPNHLATLIGFGMLGLLYLREAGRLNSRLLGGLLVLVLLLGAAATQSRTALLFGPVVWAGWRLAVWRGVVLHTHARTVAMVVALHWLLALSWPALQAAIDLAPQTGALVREGAGSARVPMWTLLIDASTLSPWLGYGVLQVGQAQLAASHLHSPAPEFWMHAHNVLLDVVLWFGYPLGLLLIGAATLWFVQRVIRVHTVEALVGVLVLAVLATHGMLELPHHYLYFLLPAGLWAGQVLAAERPRFDRVGSSRNLLPAVLALILSVGIGHRYLAVEEDFRLLRFENRRIGPASGAPATQALFLSSLTAFVKFSRIEPRAGMAAEELDFMARVVRRYPFSTALYRWARALALNGRISEASQALDALRRMHGDGNLLRVQRDLEESIAEGRTDLKPLERVVSDLLPPEARGLGAQAK